MNTSRNKRIAKNTFILYGRMFLTVGLSLYTLRVVLNTLGIEDFGLYNVVGGVVGLLTFLPGSMAAATQRNFAYALGEGDHARLKKIFTANCSVYIALAVLALLLLETAGAWFVADHVKIPPDRYEAALALYQISVLVFVVGLLRSPFQALITAHEDMHIFAGISVFEVLLNFAVALALIGAPGDKLLMYGYLLLTASTVVSGVYAWVCVRRYEECQLRRQHWDAALLREVLGFTGWTLFGQITTVFRNQAVTILMNQAFNPVVVAGRVIAFNVSNQANSFAANFNTSLYPPIIKSYAEGNLREMRELVFSGSKLSFFLMWILTLPLLLQMPYILTLWLKTPPPDAVLFTRLALIDALISSVSLPLMTAARAPGKMRAYELSLGSVQIAIFVVCWLVLKAGGAAYTVFVVTLVGSVVMLALRMVLVQRLTAIPAGEFARRVFVPVAGMTLLSLLPALAVMSILPEGGVFSLVCVLVSILCNALAFYFLGLNAEGRIKLKNAAANKGKNIVSAFRT